MKALMIAYDLQPPWDNGLKVYGRGLRDSLENIDGMELTTIADTNKMERENEYDFVHVVQTGVEPFSMALKFFRNAIVFKHIVTPSIGLGNSLSTKLCYSVINSFQNRLVRCFSSKFVAESYFMHSNLIIPPSINTSTFVNTAQPDEEKILSLLDESHVKFGTNNFLKSSNGIVLYSGPLTKDRFPYTRVLNALKQTDSNLLIVGRAANNGADRDMMEEIISYARKFDLESRISIALKLLTEDEKVLLLNFADTIIQPFTNNTQLYVAVDPPIFLLEAMSCGKPVITSQTYSFQSLIRNGYNGYAINWDDPLAVDEALKGCKATSELGLNARQTILRDFSTEYVSKKIQAIYNDYN